MKNKTNVRTGHALSLPQLRFPEFVNSEVWEMKKLGEVASFYKGKGISKADIAENGNLPCIRYGELYTHYQEIIREVVSYTNLSAENLVLSNMNDVIIPSSGETQEDIATASCVMKAGIALGGDLNIIRTKIDGIFLSYCLNSAKKKEIAQMAQGISVVHLYSSQLQNLKIKLPILKEQQKIADCLSSIDELISLHTKKLKALKDHKKGLLQSLFPQEDEKVPKLRFPEFRDAGEWKETKLGEVGEFIGGGTPNTSIQEYWDGEFPWISSSDISEDSIYNINIRRFVSKEALNNSATKIVPKNSILIVSRVGVGKLAITEKPICTSQDFTNLTPNNYNLFFLGYYLKTKSRKIFEISQGMGIKGFTKEDISKLVLDIPPTKNEQQKIASCLSSIDDQISAQTKKVEILKQHKKGLMQQLFPAAEELYG